MRSALALLLLAGLVRADERADERAAERARAAIAEERFEDAVALCEEALAASPGDGTLLYLRAGARCGVARMLQRARGYDAAIAYLESRLDHPVTAWAYAETCRWAGEEERGIEALRRSALALEDRIHAELDLLSYLRRYDEIAARAEIAGLDRWARWARDEAARQSRVRGYTRRAWLVAALAAAVLLLGAGAALRVCR